MKVTAKNWQNKKESKEITNPPKYSIWLLNAFCDERHSRFHFPAAAGAEYQRALPIDT